MTRENRIVYSPFFSLLNIFNPKRNTMSGIDISPEWPTPEGFGIGEETGVMVRRRQNGT